MTKSLFIGIAAFSFMTVAASAQDVPYGPSGPTQLVPAPAPVGSYSASKTEKSVDSNGVETYTHQSYSSGGEGVRSSTTSQTLGPDGAPISSSSEERIATPMGSQTTTTRSTTTETDQ